MVTMTPVDVWHFKPSKHCWDKFNDLGPQLWSISVFIKTMLCKYYYVRLKKDVWDQTVFDADMILLQQASTSRIRYLLPTMLITDFFNIKNMYLNKKKYSVIFFFFLCFVFFFFWKSHKLHYIRYIITYWCLTLFTIIKQRKTCKYPSKQRQLGKVYAVIIIQCVNYKSQHAYI